MQAFVSFRAGMLAVFCLAWFVGFPGLVHGYRQGLRAPTVTPERSTQRPSDLGRRSPGFNPGFFITPQRMVPRRQRVPDSPPVYFDQNHYEEPPASSSQPRRAVPRRARKTEPAKLAQPYVAYLHELAMAMDQRLIEFTARDPVKALRTYQRLLQRAKTSKNLQQEWKASTDLGYVYYLTGRFDRAAVRFTRSAELSRLANDPKGEAIALRNKGATLIAAADLGPAREFNLAALKILTSLGTARDVHMTLNNLAMLEKNRGSYREAVSYLEQVANRRGDPSDVLMLVQRNLGNMHRQWGEYDRAIEAYTAYGNMAASMGDQVEVAEALLDSASVFMRQAAYDRALPKVREAIRVQSASKQNTDWSKKLMGDVLLELGRTSEAKIYITESGYDSSAGWLNLLTSQPQKAKQHYERLLEAATTQQNLDELFTAQTGLGRVYENLHEYGRAERHYARAMDITEEIRASLLFSERRNFFAEKINGFCRSEPAKGLARVALKQKNPVKAIHAGEVAKARGFADNLAQKTDGGHFGVPAELLQREGQLTNKLAALKTALHAVPRGQDRRRFQEMLDDIKQQDSERKAFIKTLCEQCKDYCTVKYPEPLHLRDAVIHDAEYILIYDVLGDAVGITLLHGKRVIRSSLTPWQADDLEKQVARLRKPFEQVQLTKFSVELAAKLYDKLLAEALKSIPPGSAIAIIPDGALALLPFEALVTSGKAMWSNSPQGTYPAGLTYVADRHTLTYYQSLTAMTLVRALDKRTRDRTRMLVMADPVFAASDERVLASDSQLAQTGGENADKRQEKASETVLLGGMNLRRLPESEKLGKSLKELLGANCQLYMGLACTKQNFLQTFSSDTPPYRAVVFGTHGFAANDLPGIMEPALAMTMVPRGTDGLLTMSEVAGLRMDVDTAALTACKTGLGMRLAGEGVLSMGRAFQTAGAKSVIMSLWSVAEEPSIALMEKFFRELASGKDKLVAWTAARAHIRAQGFEHPFFWASFILVGETR